MSTPIIQKLIQTPICSHQYKPLDSPYQADNNNNSYKANLLHASTSNELYEVHNTIESADREQSGTGHLAL